MSTRHRWTPAPPDAVWEVLADGWTYAVFVVGTAHMRDVDATWPAPGALLHHAVGGWPLMLKGTSTCHEVVPERRLVMTARGWPMGEARVVMTLEPRDGGTFITIEEDACAGPGRFVPRALRSAVIGPRNDETLSRLEDLALGRARRASGGHGPAHGG